jgi:hypothetical protein
VARLEQLLVGWQRQLLRHQMLRLFLVRAERDEQELDIAVLEVVGALLDLVLLVDIAIGQRAIRAIGPRQVVDVVDALQVHREPL